MRSVLCLLLLALLFPALLVAEFRKTPDKGMSPDRVFELWGEPESRQEFETARESRWNYPRATVVFKKGKVERLDWHSSQREKKSGKGNSKKQPGLDPSKEIAMQDILSEIIEEDSVQEEKE